MKSNPKHLLDASKFVYYNWLCNRVKRGKGGLLIPFKGAILMIDKGASLTLSARLRLNTNCFKYNGRTCLLRMDRDSALTVNGAFDMYYGCDVVLFSGGKLTLGKTFINSDTKIRCKSDISIGNNTVISHSVTIQDYDGHSLSYGDQQPFHPNALPIHIGDHVWIGNKATILKGVTIGDGAVIAAGSVVTKDIPQGCLAAGVPARVIRENVRWE